ncbi:MAG: cytochrome c biogenesis protein CcsA [Planctomycetes bacterium]|nr:cytochrome c biogenesis protein CcsA [Planctomycetota bacterium]MBI3848015.1 cytochrome c biogenesis protein CcsA [Planctomycetota bacterium]
MQHLELTKSLCLHFGVLFYTLAALFGVAFLFSVPFVKLWLCKTCTLLGFLAHTGYLAVVWANEGAIPIFRPTDLQFTLVWLVVFGFSIVDVVWRTRYVVSFVMPAVVLFSFGVIFFIQGRAGMHGPQDGLMATHVILAIFGYESFVFAFVVGLMYLAQVRQLKTKRFQSLFQRLPSLEVLDRLNFVSVVFGLGAMTLAIIAVLAWASGHGSYSARWWLDPRILSPSALWLFYVVLLIGRITARVRGRKVALLTVFGFLGMIVLLIGMSVVTGQGPHPESVTHEEH